MLRANETVTNIVHIPGAAVEPAGDLIICDVAREEVSVVVEGLCAAGVDREGSIVIQALSLCVASPWDRRL